MKECDILEVKTYFDPSYVFSRGQDSPTLPLGSTPLHYVDCRELYMKFICHSDRHKRIKAQQKQEDKKLKCLDSHPLTAVVEVRGAGGAAPPAPI